MLDRKLFDVQRALQCKLKGKTVDDSIENVVDMYNAATGALVEIGEMLQCDTRWKAYTTGSKKEPVYDEAKFLEEWADVYIYMMNVLIYAGIDEYDAEVAVTKKQFANMKRFGLL